MMIMKPTEVTSRNMRRESIAEQAAEWLVTMSDPERTSAEREAFVGWLRRSNLHVEEFLCVSALTQRLSGSDLWPHDSVEELVAQARGDQCNVTPLAGLAPTESVPKRAYTRRWALAACTVAMIAGLVVLAVELGLPGWRGTTYTTAVGEIRSILLEDGTVVELNTQSSLRTRFTENVRAVELLRGEAIFKVARNPARSFRVAAGSAEIVALGTAFNVYAGRAQTVVTVLEGRVRVSDRTAMRAKRAEAEAVRRDMELGGGEQAVIAPHRPIARVTLAEPDKVTSWTQRRLIFEDTPLAVVAEEFARYSARTIRIVDAALATQRITGVFDATDPGSLVQFLATHGGISIREEPDGWTLSGAPPLLDAPISTSSRRDE